MTRADLGAAITSKDGAKALIAALALWTEDRKNTALADLIDAISERVSLDPISDDGEWMRTATRKNPLDLGRLLPAVTSFNVSFLPGAADILSSFPPDPRIANAVATWALEPPTTSSSTYPFWTRLLDTTAKIGDPRAIDLFKKRLKRKPGDSLFWGKFYAALKKTSEKIAKVPGAASPSMDAATIKKLTAEVSKLSKISLTASGAAAAGPKSSDVPKVSGPPLFQAHTHLSANRIGPAIDALVEFWRDVRRPHIADLVDRATRLLPNWDLPISSSGSPKEAFETWMNLIASDPNASLPQLLAAVNAGGASNAERRVLELSGLPDDPRISCRLADLSAQFGISPERTQYWKSLWQTVARHRDVRVCEPLAKAFRDFTGTYYDHHRQGKRIVAPFLLDPKSAFPGERWPLEIEDPEHKRDLIKVEAALSKLEAKKDRAEHNLLAEIVKDRKDPAPYLVYADWLSERGHPRGELIVLAGKKKPTGAETKRMKELQGLAGIYGPLQELGEFADVFHGLGAKLTTEWFTGALTWRAAKGHPLMSILETIKLSDNAIHGAEAVVETLLHEDNKCLTRIEGVTKKDHAEIAKLLTPHFKEQGRAVWVRS